MAPSSALETVLLLAWFLLRGTLCMVLCPQLQHRSPPAESSSQHLVAVLSRQPLQDCKFTNCSLCTCSIFEERSRLSRQLVDTVVPQIDSGSDQVIANAGGDNSKLTQLSDDLEQNLRDEQQFNVQMLYAVFRFQLNPLQVCCLVVSQVQDAAMRCHDSCSIALLACQLKWQVACKAAWSVVLRVPTGTHTCGSPICM